MIKRLTLTIATILWLSSSALVFAADVPLGWTGDIRATAYRIYMSTDFGANWTQVGSDIPQPDPFPTDEKVSFVVRDVPRDVLILFKAAAMRGAEEYPLPYAGIWYDHRLFPPKTSQLHMQ